MHSTSDPGELLPLTELANRELRHRVQKVPEFATSSRWQASAVVVRINEATGFEAQVGFDLRTPLGEPFQDVIAARGSNPEAAVRNAVDEWLELVLPAAIAIHSGKDPAARLGETSLDHWVYGWRLAAGVLRTVGADADTAMADLKQHGLFERLGLATVLPLQREVPWFCLKLRLTRGEDGAVTVEARLNDQAWAAGADLLKRFALPGVKPLEVKQYLFIRPTGKRPAGAGGGVPVGTGGKHAAPAKPVEKRPWWKVW